MLEQALLSPVRRQPPPERPTLSYAGPERRSQPARHWPAALLDEIDYGVLLVDRHLRLTHANRAARARIDGHSALCLHTGALSCREATDRHALESAVLLAADRGLRRLLHLGQGQNGIGIAVLPIPGDAPAGACVMLLMSRPHVCEPLSTEWFARIHGLTATESRVLQALCAGQPPSDIAERLGVALSTVRTHVSTIRSKTGTASVRELLQQVAQLPPMLHALRL
jgi:DNA-binding CsgD family transcriptional regulator